MDNLSVVHCPISGFWPHLSSLIRVRQAVEGQELGPFAQVMRDSGDTVSGHIFGQSHKTGSREAIAAFVSGKGAFTAARITAIASLRLLSCSESGWLR